MPSGKPAFLIEMLHLPLRYEWKLSRNSSVSKTNGILKIQRGDFFGMGEVAPNIRYDETPERVKAEFDSLKTVFENQDFIENQDQFASLKVCKALQMGLDMALTNLKAAENGVTPASLLGLSEPQARDICYTIPVMDPSLIQAFIESENLRRFSWLKIKVNSETGLQMVKEVLRNFQGQIAIDGNEAWKDKEQALAFACSLPEDRILFLEQPLPASMRSDYEWLSQRAPLEIWGDESVLSHPEPDFWKSSFSGINVKLMKAGSFTNAIQMFQVAREAGLKTMVGCMVETSLGILAAMQLESLADYMDLDGFLLLQNEPFGLLHEEGGMVFPCPKV